MRMHDWYLAVISGERRTAGATVARVLFHLLAWPFALLVRLRYQAYRLGLLPVRHLANVKIISVGNITAGGTGKTPLVQLLTQAMQERGLQIGIAARGYGGVRAGGPALVSDGRQVRLTPREAGDEPFLLMRELPGVPVAVDRSKAAAAELLARECKPAVIVVDDGFQHQGLARDLDIVLLDAAAPFANGFLLPRGLLREAPGALQRAGIIVITRAQAVADLAPLRRQLAVLAPAVPVFTADLRATELRDFRTAAPGPLTALADKRVVMLSGIAAPDSFEQMVQAAGAKFTVRYRLPDHHTYTPQDMVVLRRLCTESKMDCVVTTAKDAVKLSDVLDVPVPVLVLRVAMSVREPEFIDTVLLRAGVA